MIGDSSESAAWAFLHIKTYDIEQLEVEYADVWLDVKQYDDKRLDMEPIDTITVAMKSQRQPIETTSTTCSWSGLAKLISIR